MSLLLVTTRFSVVIIAYKRKEFLIKAVNSVLNQNYPKELIEIIVVKSFKDDEIDRTLSEKLIKSIYTELKSIGKKFSLGFQNSSGDIICMLEDDDAFSELKLKTIAEVYEADKQIDVFLNGYDIVDTEGKVIDVNFYKQNREFQSKQSLIKIDSQNYNPDLFQSLNLYFNNSRFSFTKSVAQSLIPVLNLIERGVDVLMPNIWIGMNLNIAFIPGIKNKFMIRNFKARKERLMHTQSSNALENEIERSQLLLGDYISLIKYFHETNIQLANFIELEFKMREIMIDVLSLSKRKLLHDLKEFYKTSIYRKGKKYKVFLRRTYISYLKVSLLSPFFIFDPEITRRIIIRLML